MSYASDPKVSVVLPTYNRAALLDRSIMTVLAQTYDDFELLVIDDGSTDDTHAVVQRFTDQRLRCHRLDSNVGPGAARNVGIRAARGEFVAFQDSDDEWTPDKLERQMAAFARAAAAVGVIYSDMSLVRDDGTVVYHPSPSVTSGRAVDPATGFYQVYMLGIVGVVVRTECLLQVGGFDEQLPAFEDLELLTRLAQRYEFIHIPQSLVRHHRTGGRSDNLAAECRARCRLLRSYYREIGHCSRWALLKETSLFGIAPLARAPLPALVTRVLRRIYRPRVAPALRAHGQVLPA
ncbi:MAG TPA: glycosyltransferase family A protein [Candidatus Binatia bacterium]|nr:glycosyltransferase family A protein [Candidatus Binatia bacterium]